ncbi:MAG: phenylalanine--tRNA ligase subunit beta, partial [Candidatus Paceibacterota bacterium]
EVPTPEKLRDIFTYHLCEVEGIEKFAGAAESTSDTIFDINILPNRAHDLLSHQGIARELASLLNIPYVDPIPKYKTPESHPTKLIKEIKSSKCRRYMGRVIRNIKVGPSPEWVVKHLESIGQRSINNIVDATNITMYDCGQPAHVFDLAKVKNLKLEVRNALPGEKIILLGGEEKTLDESMMVIADDMGNALDIAGIKGGNYAELTNETKDIILECANFDPTSVRKTAQALNIFTDARKRFENDLSPEFASLGMTELSALIYEMCPDAIFEDIVDVYPTRQEERKLSFSVERMSSILGSEVSGGEIKEILKRYNFVYKNDEGRFEIEVPQKRLDLVIEEDMAEEIGRVIGYDKVNPKLPKINFTLNVNETYAKIRWARNKLLNEGYSEVVTYTFTNKGEVEVEKSASDKKFLRTNLSDGLKESLKLNKINAPLLGTEEVKVFEIGTIFKKDKEEIHIGWGNKKEVKEMSLEEYASQDKDFLGSSETIPRPQENPYLATHKFAMWSLFPFISRDVAVWVPEDVMSQSVLKIIKENMGDMVVKGPDLFDEFKKDGKVSYAFRLVFQAYDRTLTDEEVNEVMNLIHKKITENENWQVR